MNLPAANMDKMADGSARERPDVASLPPPGVNDRMPASISKHSDMTHRRAFRWRLLSLASGGLLAATFFMPSVQGCNNPIIPAEEAWEFSEELRLSVRDMYASIDLEDLAVAYYVLTAGYLFGLLVALAALGRLTKGQRIQSLTRVCLILFTLILGGGIGLVTSHLGWRAGLDGLPALFSPTEFAPLGSWLPFINFVLLPLWMMSLLVILWRGRNPPELSIAFVTGLFAAHWFSYWSIMSWWNGDDHYGIHLSFGASCVIVAAALGEARAVSRQSWMRTLGQLMTGRFRGQDERIGMCPKCGYNLYGLSEQRCPECGRAFTFEEVGATAETLGFSERAESLIVAREHGS